MSRKMFLFLFGIIFLFPNLVFANVLINEIMYAPEAGNSEWIEIFNSGDSSINLTDLRFFNNEEDSAPLRLQKGVAVLRAGGYAIITNTSNWSSFSGNVFSSSQFSLPNDSSKYNTYKAISNADKEIINYVNYTTTSDAFNNGNSLQLINGSWMSAPATLGVINETQSHFSVEVNTISGAIEENNITTINTQKQKIKTQILADRITFVGVPLKFNAITTGHNGEMLSYGKYFWNFGDGDFKETRINENKFSHTYFYPGEHSVNLEYYMIYYSENPEAVDKIIIKVITPDIVISNVGNEKDFFIELTNNTNYDADISKWILISNRINFVLPKNTILESKKKMIISSRITNFSIDDKNALKLMTPQREVIYDYLASISSASSVKKIVQSQNSPVLAVKMLGTFEEISDNNLSASTILSENEANNNSYIPVFALVLFLGATSSTVYFIRRKKGPMVAGDDFELIDE